MLTFHTLGSSATLADILRGDFDNELHSSFAAKNSPEDCTKQIHAARRAAAEWLENRLKEVGNYYNLIRLSPLYREAIKPMDTEKFTVASVWREAERSSLSGTSLYALMKKYHCGFGTAVDGVSFNGHEAEIIYTVNPRATRYEVFLMNDGVRERNAWIRATVTATGGMRLGHRDNAMEFTPQKYGFYLSILEHLHSFTQVITNLDQTRTTSFTTCGVEVTEEQTL